MDEIFDVLNKGMKVIYELRKKKIDEAKKINKYIENGSLDNISIDGETTKSFKEKALKNIKEIEKKEEILEQGKELEIEYFEESKPIRTKKGFSQKFSDLQKNEKFFLGDFVR